MTNSTQRGFQPNARPTKLAPAHPLEVFSSSKEAVARLIEIFEANTAYIRKHFQNLLEGKPLEYRVRAFYPQVQIVTDSHIRHDSRLSYGFVSGPGRHAATITRPDLYRNYLETQLSLLMKNHEVPILVGDSDMPIPLHFAFYDGTHVEGGAAAAQAVLPQRSATRTTQSAPDAPISNSPPVDGGPKSGVDGFQGLVIPLGGIKTGPAEYERIAQDDKTTSGRRGHEALRPRQARFSDRRRRVSGRQRQRTTAPSVAAKGSGKGNKRK